MSLFLMKFKQTNIYCLVFSTFFDQSEIHSKAEECTFNLFQQFFDDKTWTPGRIFTTFSTAT